MLLAFDWTELAQQTVIGLASGGVWATLAVALVLIYRSTGVVNFAGRDGDVLDLHRVVARRPRALVLGRVLPHRGDLVRRRGGGRACGDPARRARAGADGRDRHARALLPRQRRRALDLVARGTQPAECVLDPADRG